MGGRHRAHGRKRNREDEPSLVLTLTDRLESEGYSVESRQDGTRRSRFSPCGSSQRWQAGCPFSARVPHAMPSTRTVDVHVAWLRQKLEDSPKVPQLILTIRGLGYKFTG
jgi:DNA-binding response OmpR family regulator